MLEGIAEIITAVSGFLTQLFTFLVGPHGGFIISVLFNFILVGLLVFLVLKLMEQIKQKDKQISEKERQIDELTEDVKLLAIKSALTNEEFMSLLRDKIITLEDSQQGTRDE